MQAQQSVALTLEGAQLERPDWSYQAGRWTADAVGLGISMDVGMGNVASRGRLLGRPLALLYCCGMSWCEVVTTLGKGSGHVDHILEEVCLTKGPRLHACLSNQACRVALMRFPGGWGGWCLRGAGPTGVTPFLPTSTLIPSDIKQLYWPQLTLQTLLEGTGGKQM